MRKRMSPGVGGRRMRLLFVDHDEPRGHSFLVPIVVTLDVIIFLITMYVNDCPEHSHNCTIRSLGRLSFEPMSDNPLLGPSSSALSEMGGISRDKLANGHQLWRPFSCIWLHAGLIHLLVDLLSLLFIGIRLEQDFGCLRVGGIYFLSGIGGSLLSSLFIENQVSVGSSGALFGLMGAIVAEILPNWTLYSKKFATLTTLGLIALLNLIVGIFPHVGNFSHVGGFLFGFFLGFIFFMRPHFSWRDQTITPPTRRYDLDYETRHKMCQMLLWAMAVLVLVIAYLVLMVLAFRGVDANAKCSWCRNFSCAPSSRWKCDGGSGSSSAYCKYLSTGSTLVLTCTSNSNQNSQVYTGYFTAQAMKRLCAELCAE